MISSAFCGNGYWAKQNWDLQLQFIYLSVAANLVLRGKLLIHKQGYIYNTDISLVEARHVLGSALGKRWEGINSLIDTSVI